MSITQSQPDASSAQPRTRRQRPLDDRLAWRRAEVLGHLQDPRIVAENPHTLSHSANSIHNAFKPRNHWQDWVTGTVATVMVRIDRCERIERRLRDLASYRAIDFWEDDQEVEVETLALKLGKQPARTVAKLRTTPAGLEWLLRRWRFLAGVPGADWTDAQRELAVNLVGADPILDPMAPGFAAAMVADLESRRERVAEADTIARGLVEADLNDDAVPGLAKLRRYNRSLHRQMRWYIDTFHVEHPDRWDDPARKPAFLAHDLIAAQAQRQRHWPFNPPPAPTPDHETPAADAIEESENYETKPTVPTDHWRNEANPANGPHRDAGLGRAGSGCG